MGDRCDHRDRRLSVSRRMRSPTGQPSGVRPVRSKNFKIGGYQVCDKWLKDRKGRVLSDEDISHYQRVVVSLKETMRLMAEIDAVIPGWPME